MIETDDRVYVDGVLVYCRGCSRVLCVLFKKTDKQYTETDVDLLINNNLGFCYAKSAERYRKFSLIRKLKNFV